MVNKPKEDYLGVWAKGNSKTNRHFYIDVHEYDRVSCKARGVIIDEFGLADFVGFISQREVDIVKAYNSKFSSFRAQKGLIWYSGKIENKQNIRRGIIRGLYYLISDEVSKAVGRFAVEPFKSTIEIPILLEQNLYFPRKLSKKRL